MPGDARCAVQLVRQPKSMRRLSVIAEIIGAVPNIRRDSSNSTREADREEGRDNRFVIQVFAIRNAPLVACSTENRHVAWPKAFWVSSLRSSHSDSFGAIAKSEPIRGCTGVLPTTINRSALSAQSNAMSKSRTGRESPKLTTLRANDPPHTGHS